MNQTVNKRKQSTVVRLFSQLKVQRVGLTVVAISIVIDCALSMLHGFSIIYKRI